MGKIARGWGGDFGTQSEQKHTTAACWNNRTAELTAPHGSCYPPGLLIGSLNSRREKISMAYSSPITCHRWRHFERCVDRGIYHLWVFFTVGHCKLRGSHWIKLSVLLYLDTDEFLWGFRSLSIRACHNDEAMLLVCSTYGYWGFWKNICQSNLYYLAGCGSEDCEVELLLTAVCRQMENQPSLLVL